MRSQRPALVAAPRGPSRRARLTLLRLEDRTVPSGTSLAPGDHLTLGPVTGTVESVTPTASGYDFAGSFSTPLGGFHLSGSLQNNGDIHVTGSTNVAIGAVGGPVTLTVNDIGGAVSVHAGGTMTTPIGTFGLTGDVAANGNYTLTGTGNVSLGAVGGSATLTVSRQNGALTVSGNGHFQTPIGSFGLSGEVRPDGGFTLTGSADVALGAARGTATVTVGRQGTGGLTVHGDGRLLTPVGAFNVAGDFQSNGDFRLVGSSAVSLSGVGGNATLTVSRTNGHLDVAVGGPAFTTPMGNFSLSGYVQPDGSFSLTGSAGVSIGVVSGSAHLAVSNQHGAVSASVDGQFTSPVGGFRLEGNLQPGGDFLLRGQAAVPFGPVSGNATLSVSRHAGVVAAHVDGTVYTAVGTFSVNGDIATNGNFRLTGSADVAVGPVSGRGSLAVSKAGSAVTAGVDATVNTSVGSFHINGDLRPGGNYTLTGSANVTAGPVSGNGTLSVAKNGAAVTAHLDAHVNTSLGTFGIVGDLQPGGNFSLTGSANVTVGPASGSASLTVRKNGSAVSASLDGSFNTSLGRFGLSGALQSNGNFSITGSANVTLGPASGGVTLTVARNGSAVSANASGSMDTSIGRFGLSGSVQSNGNFSLTGTANVTLGPASGGATLTVSRNGSAVSGSLNGSFNTPLGRFGLSGALQSNGNFSITGSAGVTLGPVSGTASLTVSKSGSSVSASTNGSLNTPLGRFGLSGSVANNGSFTLTGSARASLGGFSDNSASLRVARSAAGSVTVSANFHSQYTALNVVRGDFYAAFTIGGSLSHPTWSVSGHASAQVNVPIFGWQTVADIGLGISNHSMTFGVDTHIPGIGVVHVSVPLPF